MDNEHLTQMAPGSGGWAPTPTGRGVAGEQAQRYAQHVAPTLVTLARRVVDLAELEPGYSVLDAATATGLAAFLAAERVGRDGSAIGFDASTAMLTVARERAEAAGTDFIRWHQGDVTQLTYADESFDAVLCIHGLMEMARPDAALEEIRRVLVEGGRLVATLWGSKDGNEWMGLLEHALRRAGSRVVGPKSFSLRQPGNLEALLQALDYQDIEVARVPDRLRFRGVEGLWQWAKATPGWGAVLEGLPAAAQSHVRATLEAELQSRIRDGEVTLQREIVYARAVAPEAA
jgi:ubiquinone/menaquinone biosynthesis C-methylase UbiE